MERAVALALVPFIPPHVSGLPAGRPATPRRFTLNGVLLAAISLALLVGMVPAGIAIDRRLQDALITKAREDLAMAPRLLADRNAAYSDALMMRAKDLAHAPGLAEAVARGDRGSVLTALETVRPTLGAAAPLVAARDTKLSLGPVPDASLIAATQRGQMPVKLTSDGATIRNMALAPIELDHQWLGAAGVALTLDDQEVIGLKGLLRADLIVVSTLDGHISATTLDTTLARAVLGASRAAKVDSATQEISIGGARYLVIATALADAGSVLFVRPIAQELALIPALRRTAALPAALSIALALLLATWLARRITRPVRQLAAAAEALGAGSFDTALPESRLAEVATVAERFGEMREALRSRMLQLRESNEALQERSARLQALQADLMQRERLAAAGRLVAQLAHEIRNPVASLRNCLEIVRRRVAHDPEGVEFADLAINELLRMHELAEQMLDVSRPRADAVADCKPVAIARDVVRLVTAGVAASEFDVTVTGESGTRAAIAGDALKQVLLNLVHNAREAGAGRHEREPRIVRIHVARVDAVVTITVDDDGPGVPESARQRIFDPFYSTKSDMQGVGLGLFVAEGLVRSAGGRIAVEDAPIGGARFTIALPTVQSPENGVANTGDTTTVPTPEGRAG